MATNVRTYTINGELMLSIPTGSDTEMHAMIRTFDPFQIAWNAVHAQRKMPHYIATVWNYAL